MNNPQSNPLNNLETNPLLVVVEQLPKRDDFFLNTGLYHKFKIHINSIETLKSYYFSPTFGFDCYCTECKKHSTFQQFNSEMTFNHILQNSVNTKVLNRVATITYTCTRVTSHAMSFLLFIDSQSKYIMKVGQYPSLADITKPEYAKFRPVLGEDKHKELIKGLGLFAHGSGIGSFVYLRRIFETLIELAHKDAVKQSTTWDEKKYENGRVDDKILLLKAYLPEFMVKNRVLYSILSYGVHELSEELCMKAFPVVLKGIELILDNKLVEHLKELKEKEGEKEIQALSQFLKTVKQKP